MPSYLDRLAAAIPGGAHVHVKSHDQFPTNTPKITTRAEGVYLYDEDGAKYLDYGMGLRSVSIGYSNDFVNQGAIKEIEKGNCSSLPTTTELCAAEILVDLIDSVDMVKFTKDGSTATTAALKLARAYTGKEMVARCADQPFFSYDDWFIGTTAWNRGCLENTYAKTKLFKYNDINSVKDLFDEFPNQFACLILEPANSTLEPENNFLFELRELCHKNNVLLIFDEIVTGFRWDMKGAQNYYNVKPDLCTFGKGMANGFSVSALGGIREIMKLGSIEEKERVFFLSTTHGAEMSSLGAMIATVEFYKKNDVVKNIWDFGQKIMTLINNVAKDCDVDKYFSAIGLGCLPFYSAMNGGGVRDPRFIRLFQQEMAREKIIIRNIAPSYSHGEDELKLTEKALYKCFPVYKKALEHDVETFLMG